MSGSRFFSDCGFDPSLIAPYLPQWRVIQETNWDAEPVQTFNADGVYIMSDGSRWYKENTAAETFPPTIVAGLGLRFQPNNVGDLAGRANGLLSTRNVDLGLALPNDTPIRMSFMLAGANNPSGNALWAMWGYEVSPPGGVPPQQHCMFGRVGMNGPVAWPGAVIDWTWQNVYNNAGAVILGDTVPALIAVRCYRFALRHGMLPWATSWEVGDSVGPAWPAVNRWGMRAWGSDWGGNLYHAQAFPDVLTRGMFNYWGQVLTAYRGFGADPAAYIIIRKTRLEAWY